jgi:hypothetical protein
MNREIVPNLCLSSQIDNYLESYRKNSYPSQLDNSQTFAGQLAGPAVLGGICSSGGMDGEDEKYWNDLKTKI